MINLKEADQRKSQLHHFTIRFQKPGICADSRFLESSKLMRMTGSKKCSPVGAQDHGACGQAQKSDVSDVVICICQTYTLNSLGGSAIAETAATLTQGGAPRLLFTIRRR